VLQYTATSAAIPKSGDRENLCAIRFSVVICAYTEDRWSGLVAAVSSVKAQSVPAEIIVVIDHNQRLYEFAKAALHGSLVLANRGTRGLSGARNTGWAAASGDVVAFLDDDAVAEQDWLEHLAEAYQGDIAAVGGAIVPVWESHRPAWFPEEFDWVVGCTYRGLPETMTEVRNVIGANMSFRRDALRALDGFRDGIGRVGALPVGCEETELCLRLRERWPDRRIMYTPMARVRHRVPRKRASCAYFIRRCLGEGISKAVLTRAHGSRGALETERAYLRRVLRRASTRYLGDVLRGDPGGAGRLGAIAFGVAAAAIGYGSARLLRLESLASDLKD
jgi:glycosyltransferase involved in cell wall biosynthesis